jgi:ribonucleoside-diphosphate reductase alpha chain
MDLDGVDSYSIQYQNANNSVRVSDEFMRAYEQDQDWKLKAVTTGEAVDAVRARELTREIAQAAWECADPGMQYDTTINEWHTCPASGRINASNPCSEYMHLDNSACNLASLNLMKFIDEDGTFDVKSFRKAVEIVFTAQEIIVGPADYPTEKIAENARSYRQLGLGYANLGALLMARGLPYRGDHGPHDGPGLPDERPDRRGDGPVRRLRPQRRRDASRDAQAPCRGRRHRRRAGARGPALGCQAVVG